MQDTTKDQDTKGRRMNPIRVADTPRLGAPHADTLREVHSSLVRAGQNLYNLVQTNQATNGIPPSPAPPQPYTPSFGPGFATAGYGAAMAQQPYFNGLSAPGSGFGAYAPTTPPGPAAAWGMQAPAFVGAAWKSLTADIAAALGALQPIAIALGSLQHAAAIVPGVAALPATAYGTFGASGAATTAAAYDLIDEGKQFVCLVDLPGLKPAQVELLVVEQAVIVTAYRESELDTATLLQSERGAASLQRTIVLPAEVQPAAVKATLADGVLTIALPKVNPTEGPRRIKVQG